MSSVGGTCHKKCSSYSSQSSLYETQLGARTLSASNLNALSDSDLSLRAALPKRSYDDPQSRDSSAKQVFANSVRRYFYQLTEGCGTVDCDNRFCLSCPWGLKLHKGMAFVFSIQLCSRTSTYFCPGSVGFESRQISKEVLNSPPEQPKPFLYALYESLPFQALFKNPNEEVFFNFNDRHRSVSPALSSSGGNRGFSRPKSLLLSSSRERRNSAPHLHGDETVVDSSKSRLQLPFDSRQRLAHLPFSKPQQLTMHGSLGDLSPQSLIKTKAIRKIHQGSTSSSSAPPDKLPGVTSEGSVWLGTKIRPCWKEAEKDVSPASSLTSLDLPLIDVTSQDEDFDDNAQEQSPILVPEDVGDPPTQFSLTHFTLEMVTKAVADYDSTGDSAFVENSIRTVFSSFEAMSLSFLKRSDLNPSSLDPDVVPSSDVDEISFDLPSSSPAYSQDQPPAISPPAQQPVLDIGAALSAFDLLWRLEPSTNVAASTMDALEILLMEIAKDEEVMENEAFLRVVVLILVHPVFEDVNKHGPAATVFNLAQVFWKISFKPELSSRFIDMLRDLVPDRQMRNLVDRFKEVLTDSRIPVRTEMMVDRSIVEICVSLSVLHQSCVGRNDIDLKIFYCNDLCKQLDLSREYDAWMRLLQENPGTNTTNNSFFTFLSTPFLLDPPTKVKILHLDACAQMRIRYQEAIVHQAIVNQVEKYKKMLNRSLPIPQQVKASMCPFLVLEIRRDHLLEDAFHQIQLKEQELKKPLRIIYVGLGEQGLDMGGLQKEFFQVISHALFDPVDEKDLFVRLLSPSNLFWFSSDSHFLSFDFSSFPFCAEDPLSLWFFVGAIVGLAVYNGIIIPAQFPLALYKKILSQPCGLEDLRQIEPSVCASLKDILEYDGDDFENTFCLNFRVHFEDLGGSYETVDLIPDGDQIPVTLSSRFFFVEEYMAAFFQRRNKRQFSSFSSGFHCVAGEVTLDLFTPEELQLLVAGSNELNFKALERSCQYEDGYSSSHPTVRIFWSVVHEDLDQDSKKKLLHFVTGSDRVPLQGLGKMPMIVQWHGEDSERLPSAMTCFNRLLLPQYQTRHKLRTKLEIALKNCHGFGLS